MEEWVASIGDFFYGMKKAMRNIDKNDIKKAIEVLEHARLNNKTVYLMGNGGSASTAIHFCSDLKKTTIRDGYPRFRSICLNDNIALQTAWANDSSFDDVYVEQLREVIEPGDVLIGFSTSGGGKSGSRNLVKALKYAREVGAKTIGFLGGDGGKMLDLCDVSIIPVVITDDVFVIESLHVILTHFITRYLKS